MDLHVPAPSSTSDDGMYQLAEMAAPPAPEAPVLPIDTAAQAQAQAPAAAEEESVNGSASVKSKPDAKSKGKKVKKENKGGGGFASFWKRGPAKAETEKEKTGEPAAPVKLDAAARKKRRRRRSLKRAIPSWGVSAVIHLVILVALGAATFSTEVRKKILNIDSALVSNPGGADEMVHILADPSNQPRDQAAGSEGASAPAPAGGGGGGGGSFGGIGTGPPSNTPRVSGGGNINDKSGGLPGVKVVANVSGLSLATLAAPSMDLGGGGGIAGDVTYGTKDIGEALDQLAREILRHLSEHKLTVVWLFDESESMKDDQQEIKRKFDRITNELRTHEEAATKKKVVAPLTHAVVGFGETLHFEQKKPTSNIDVINQAIDKLRVDDTGTENTMHAIAEVINTYSSMITKDRRLLIVLVTDESGDDGGYVEEVHQMVVNAKVPLYVIGRQSLFGYDRAHLQYIDPVTKDVYWPTIRRGPETADIEMLQYDGLHDRWDEQPSGFAPYELARLAKATGGIYFLLPSEENMRVRQREKAYSIKDLKEYVPDYESRAAYAANRNKSEFRRSLYEIIQLTRPKSGEDRGFALPREFPIDPAQFMPVAQAAINDATVRLNGLLKIQQRLEGLQKLRDRETEKRWQAAYDLMLAQVVAYEVKAFEYRAVLEEMMKKPPKPSRMPSADLLVVWVMDHSHDRKAPKEKTAKKYAEAEKLLKEVIARHPKTPWSDLAQDELNRGLGVQRNEWHHNPKYNERAKLVPKY